MEDINIYFEVSDVWKVSFALIAGLILGYERESKDKSAGLKTITIITLGSTLFAILSENYSGEGDSYSIAAGIISGVGFLGAGVIFKEGFTIYGLTTAGIIWVSAAIGMAIGFGEFYLASLFVMVTLTIVYGTQVIGKYFIPNNILKSLQIEIAPDYIQDRSQIIQEIAQFTIFQTITKVQRLENNHLAVEMDVQIQKDNAKALEDFLIRNNQIVSFTL